MKIIDITRVAQQAPIYPGSSPIVVERICDMAAGAPFNASKITTGSHMGTHADSYYHFMPDSPVTIDKMELWRYYGPCRVVTVSCHAPIARAALEGKLDGCERLVLHGGGMSYLTADAARYLVEMKLVTVVTDAWSVAPLDNEAEIHGILFGGGLAVVESVCLDGVADGDYTLCAFPIKLGGCDGAPVRAVLLEG